VREADEFRRRAAFCISLARTADDQTIKAALIDMAQGWLQLANRVDFAEPPPSPPVRLMTAIAVTEKANGIRVPQK
jgi:hypothetical protein